MHSQQKTLYFILCICITYFCGSPLVIAQQSNGLEQMLDRVDSQSSWAKVPVSAPPAITNQQLNTGNLYLRQQLLHTLMGGQPAPSHNSSPNNKKDWSSSTAYSDWQQAENEASRAYNASQRARYDQDKSSRQSAASEAYYAAQSARQASDRVYYASENGDPTAKQYASSARAAADRAQSNADQARYNADQGN